MDDDDDDCSYMALRDGLVEYFDELLKPRSTKKSREYLFEKSLHTASSHLNEKVRRDSALILSYLCYYAKINKKDAQLQNYLEDFKEQLKGLSDDGPALLFQVEIHSLKLICKEKILPECFRTDENHDFASELFFELFAFASTGNYLKTRCMMEDVLINMLIKIEPTDPKILLEVVFHILIKSKASERQIAYEFARQVIKKAAVVFDSYLNEFFDSVVRVQDSRLYYFKDHIYELIYELDSVGEFSSLLRVISNLENILKKETTATKVKKEILELLGKLFSKKNSSYQYKLKSLWLTFIASFQDVNVDIRNCSIKISPALLINHLNFKQCLEKQLSVCSKNSKQSTRLEVVNAILTITKQNISSIDKSLVKILLKRASDKAIPIRKVALVCLCRIFIAWESNHRDLSTDLTNILNKVLNSYHMSGIEDQIVVEQLMRYYITPFKMSKEKLVIRVCGIFTVINSPATIAFETLFSNQNKVRTCLQSIIENVELPNGDKSTSIIANHIKLLSAYLPESPTSLIYLEKFCQLLMNDHDVITHLKRMLNYKYSWEEIDNFFTDITKKLKNPELNESLLCIDDMTKQLLQRSILPIGIFDGQFISLLIERITSTKRETVDYFLFKPENNNYDKVIQRELDLLQFIFNLNPVSFNYENLQKELELLLCSKNIIIVKGALKIVECFGGRISDVLMNATVEKWVHLAKVGNEKELKHAVQCLAYLPKDRRKNEFSGLFKEALKTLEAKTRRPTEILILIGHIAFCIPELFQKEYFEDFNVQFNDVTPLLNESRQEIENEHVEIKVEFMNCIVKYFIGSSKAKKRVDFKYFEAFIKFLTDFFKASPIQKFTISKKNLNFLKVIAGTCVLKLATESGYSDYITIKTFRDLSTLIVDKNLPMKRFFASKLNKMLMSLKLPMEYITLLILGVFEEDVTLRNSVKKYIVLNINKRIKAGKKSNQYPSNLLPYAIYLLAHHPTFIHYKQSEILHTFKNCLWLLLEPLIMVNNNYDFLSQQLRRLKQAEVVESDLLPSAIEHTEFHNKVYVLCDLCLGMLKTKAKSSSVVIKDFSINPMLPAKLFKFSGKIPQRNYLPSNFIIKIPEDWDKNYKPDITEVETSSEEEESKNLIESSDDETFSEEENERSSSATRKRSSSRANITIPASKRSKRNTKDNTI